MEKPQESFWERFGNAWSTGLKNALNFFRDLALDFAEHFLAWLILIAGVIAGVIITKRVVRKNRKASGKEQQPKEKEAAKKTESAENAQSAGTGNGEDIK